MAKPEGSDPTPHNGHEDDPLDALLARARQDEAEDVSGLEAALAPPPRRKPEATGLDRRLWILVGIAGVALIGLLVFLAPKLTNPDKDAKPEAGSARTATPQTLATLGFDIVRVDRRGTAVIAGHGPAGAKVTIKVGGVALAVVTANAKGEWVATIEQPLAPGSQEITLDAILPDGKAISSDQSVVVVVPARDAPAGEVALVVLTQPGQPSKILQGPPGEVATGDLALDSVDYDEKGAVILAGRAKAGLTLRAYLNNQPLGTAKAAADGRWSLKPKEAIKPGTYALRLDEIGADGKVAQRLEVPFERAAPQALQDSKGSVIVQPGNSLWRIARHAYGGGDQYTVIYQANKEHIRDPDLIFPGQILAVPGR